eukprot:3667322-Rhodomonas_salina.1
MMLLAKQASEQHTNQLNRREQTQSSFVAGGRGLEEVSILSSLAEPLSHLRKRDNEAAAASYAFLARPVFVHLLHG